MLGGSIELYDTASEPISEALPSLENSHGSHCWTVLYSFFGCTMERRSSKGIRISTYINDHKGTKKSVYIYIYVISSICSSIPSASASAPWFPEVGVPAVMAV